jgi:hypothetical protein
MKVLHGIRAALKRTLSKRSAKFICIGNARSVWSACASAPLLHGDARKHSTFNVQYRTRKLADRGSVSRSAWPVPNTLNFSDLLFAIEAAAGRRPALRRVDLRKHRTTNAELRTSNRAVSVLPSAFGVQCSLFDVSF